MTDLPIHAAVALFGAILGLALSRSDRSTWIALALVIASATVARERFGMPFEADALTVPLLAAVLAVRHRPALMARASYPFAIPILIYLAANVLATALNPPLSAPALRQCLILVVRAGTFYLVLVAVQAIVERRSEIPHVLFGIAIVQATACYVAFAFLPVMSLPLVWVGLHGPGVVSFGGFFQEPNLLAAFLATVLVIALPVAAIADPAASRIARVTLAVIGPALVLTYTRSAWVGSVIGAGAFLVLLFGLARPRWRRGVTAVALVATSAGAAMALAVVLTRTDEGEVATSAAWARMTSVADPTTGTAAGRIEIWREAIHHWAERPIVGHGPLSLIIQDDVGDNRGWLFGSAIQALHDTGLVGLLAMLAVVGVVARCTWRGISATGHSGDHAALVGYLVAQGVLFFTSQFSSFFWGAYTWVLLGIAAGHAGAVLRGQRGSLTRKGLDTIQNP